MAPASPGRHEPTRLRETLEIPAPPPSPHADDRRRIATRLTETAERLDELADVADLMGDEATALRFRRDAARCRERALALLD